MKCAWQAYLNLLPQWIGNQLDTSIQNFIQETRMRIDCPPKIILNGSVRTLTGMIDQNDIQYVINRVSQYSPWASSTISDGYLTADGGHRIGICGQARLLEHAIIEPSSLNIRVARDFTGIAQPIGNLSGSILLIGSPGSGKTTLLRDLIREKSKMKLGSVCVVDEKSEIFPKINQQFCFETGDNTDVFTGCSKQEGIIMALRNMGPKMIAVDEITAAEDCEAIMKAGWCGVDLLATVHASSVTDLKTNPIFRPLVNTGIFRHYVVMNPDKSYRIEGD